MTAVIDRDRIASMRALAQWYHELGPDQPNLAPLGDDKRPVVTGIGDNGRPWRFRWQEWQETRQTDALWQGIRSKAYWSECHGVALVNGFGGWVNIDIDSRAKTDAATPPVPRAVAEEFLAALGLLADYPWLVASPTGGWHLYAIVDSLDIETGKLDRLHAHPAVDHVELRYTGHYTALPGSMHPNGKLYAWANAEPTTSPVHVDGALLLAAYLNLTQAKQKPAAPARTTASSTSSHSAYVAKAVADECARVSAALVGSRNDTLNNAALALGELVGAGVLSETEAEAALLSAALACGLDESSALATIHSGMTKGKSQPRQIPESAQREVDTADWIPDLFAPETPDHWGDDNSAVIPVGNNDIDRTLLKYRAEDGGILDCWRDRASDGWLFAAGHGTWYSWKGTHWQRDDEQFIHRQIHDLMDLMNETGRTALENLGPDMGKDDPFKSERAIYKAYINATKRTSSRVNSVMTMAQAHRATAADSLDQGNLLNLQNGTLDLKTLCLRPHDEADKLSYVLDYAYDTRAVAPRWTKFCEEVLVHETPDVNGNWLPDFELIELLQEAIGYSLTNDIRHEAMFWLSGRPNSGKSTISHILRLLLGGMALGVDINKLGAQGDYTLAEVPGKRVLYSGESHKGQRFAESTIRELVSGDTMTSARKYGHPFQFRSQAKIWWMMNDQPIVTDTSGGIWRRLQLIPFHRAFDKESRDVTLLDKLAAELPGILNWALAGLHRLQVRGRFPEPQAVQDALLEYQRESNPVQQWLEECTMSANDQGLVIGMTGDLPWTPAKECFDSYITWAEANGRQPMNSTTFGRELVKLRKKARTMTGMTYQLGLKSAPTPAERNSHPMRSPQWLTKELQSY